MRPPASTQLVRSRMRATPRRDTRAELAVRSALHRLGLRFRVDRRLLSESRGRVDVAFTGARVALFIDGCFWHGCPEHGTLPRTTNATFWAEKIAANRCRDSIHSRALRRAGWCVIRVWEHDDPQAIALRIRRLVQSRRTPRTQSQGLSGIRRAPKRAVLEVPLAIRENSAGASIVPSPRRAPPLQGQIAKGTQLDSRSGVGRPDE
jgi:DNA mismatch endonuclease (patch repair protein)